VGANPIGGFCLGLIDGSKVKLMANIIMLGVQGGGKGTQAKLMAERYRIPHISTGDIFRSLDRSTELGRLVLDLIDNGNLVPDDKTFEIVKNRLLETDCKNGYILDGFPRNINQAVMFSTLSDEYSILKLDYVFAIEIPDDESIRRLSGRRNCKKCGMIYNINTSPKPKDASLCDKCGSGLSQREDDKPIAIRRRLQDYHALTEPLKEFYFSKGVLHEIDGIKSIDSIFKDISSIVDKSYE
jgi:adenylate kinase